MTDHFTSCSIDGCDRNAHHSAKGSKGYCQAHYKRLMRYGDPLAGRTSPGEPLRFIHEVALYYQGSKCLTWPFSKGNDGYGRVYADGKDQLASRYLCILAHGEPPTPDHEAAHNCGKGHEACVTKGHLEWKTHADNMADRVIHGTSNPKLTEEQGREIIALKGLKTQREIASEFGVSQVTIAKVHQGRRFVGLRDNGAAA